MEETQKSDMDFAIVISGRSLGHVLDDIYAEERAVEGGSNFGMLLEK